MEIGGYLAMTAPEFAAAARLPPKIAWLDCHFSPEGSCLGGIPPALPPDSLLILTDRLPFRDHDPVLIARQLVRAVTALDCAALVLDFERPFAPALGALAARLAASLPCPVAVSEGYAMESDCPVFLSPCPHHVHLKDHIAPWAGRALWLDLAKDAETITVTAEGSAVSPLPGSDLPEGGHRDEDLHCHYRTETGADLVRFTLWRTREDAQALAREAEGLGVRTLVGLWSEWEKRN